MEGYAEEEEERSHGGGGGVGEETAFENEGQRRTSKTSPKSYSSGASFSLDAKVPPNFRQISLAVCNVIHELPDGEGMDVLRRRFLLCDSFGTDAQRRHQQR